MKSGYTVIIPVYNRSEKLKRAIKSVRDASNATSLPVEIVVVDDASQDDSVEVAKAEGVDCIVKLDNNVGVTGAKNHGVTRAKNEWLIFLDSDDMLVPGAFKLMESILDENIDIDILFGACRTMAGRSLASESFTYGFCSYSKLLQFRNCGEFLPICNRRIFIKIKYIKNLRGFEGVTWLEAAKRGYKLYYSDQVTRIYDDTGDDRICAKANIINDGKRLSNGFDYMITRFGSDMAKCSVMTYMKSVLRLHLYSKCANLDCPIKALRVQAGWICLFLETCVMIPIKLIPSAVLRKIWSMRLLS
jgi:glycosyltransferase involved in cell wall biosynthesis